MCKGCQIFKNRYGGVSNDPKHESETRIKKEKIAEPINIKTVCFTHS
jgi:hypothetical protein